MQEETLSRLKYNKNAPPMKTTGGAFLIVITAYE